MNIKRRVFLAGFALLMSCAVQAQQIIHLKNPSFEMDKSPKCNECPVYWDDLGDEFESPPDVQPGCFAVDNPAVHGTLFLGMVVRDNGTVEAVGQQLTGWLEKDSVYLFTASLARASQFESLSRKTGQAANYTKSCVLQIYGLNTQNNRTELLGETFPVEHLDWKDYNFEFQPKNDRYDYIQLKATFDLKINDFYNGNILVDNLSPITLKKTGSY